MSNDEKPYYNDLIGDMLKRNDETQGMQHLKGAGKPLPKEYFSGDTFQHFQRIAKDAGYKPHWLKLQHEIRDELTSISEILEVEPHTDVESRIQKLNEKIREHNKHCPPPMLKGTVSRGTINVAKGYWM
ncbi:MULTISPECIES: DnaJ family domain-containing protein [Sporosarcina]|uniref:DnaJ family domain-containing protein n=1 Tax=Sporosarcina contaminans TaxID=633403 RepID=A0ABW3U3B3_9BACL